MNVCLALLIYLLTRVSKFTFADLVVFVLLFRFTRFPCVYSTPFLASSFITDILTRLIHVMQ